MHELDRLKDQALTLMAAGGFPVSEDVVIDVDEQIRFMGYTIRKNGKPHIMVSRWSLSSGMLMGLLIHELSHIYRIETRHPSHNESLHHNVLGKVLQGNEMHPYQEEIMYNVINNLQDLYADDISFPVYIKKSGQTNINEFFLGWIKHPIGDPKTPQDRWVNAGALLNAAFAQANLERHGIKDTDHKIENAVHVFLQQIGKAKAKQFPYFKNTMVTLPEKITDEEFETVLSAYISAFLHLI